MPSGSEFPSNSGKAKSASPKKEADSNSKREPVVTGEVIRRKRSPWRRFKEFFVGQDSKSVVTNVFFDVIIPSIKDTIADAATEGIERKLFGEVRSARRGRTPASSIFGHATYNAYNRYSGGNSSSLRPDPRAQSSVPPRRGRVPQSAYDEIILETRAEAQEVIENMVAILDQYEMVSVEDLFELVGLTGEFTTEKWGWLDLRTADVQRVHEGYLLNLPRPEPIGN